MIIDFHTHIFPPDVRDRREDYIARDPTFAEMYGTPRATIATAEDLIASMVDANVDISVTLGFAWRDQDDIVRHNDYLLEAAARANGHILPFTTINMADARAESEIARCAAAGALGLGELRPENQGWDLNRYAGDRLAVAAREHNLVLLFHVTEEDGRQYPGKQGCALASFREFARKHADLKIVGAHLGGGAYRNGGTTVFVDTAAVPFLYPPVEQPAVYDAVPEERLLFGSDYPLISQSRSVSEFRAAVTGAERVHRALAGNARSLLQV
ncbi:MAG: amidohydrolase family protein [Dehalococcoidia bacterium]